MSLTWDTTKCNPSTSADKNEDQIRHTLCILTIRTGINEITAQNAADFYARIHLLEAVHGAFLSQVTTSGLKELPITPADVKRWIGLKTNASKITEAKFLASFKHHLADYRQEFKKG